MTRFDLTGKEIAERGRAIYESVIRHQLETEENIGKMVIINVETGEYQLEESIQTALAMQTPQNDAPLYGIRIGYRTAATIGGAMERIAR